MFYVYRNKAGKSEAIAQFTDEENAHLYMEHLAIREIDPSIIGYAVRDYQLNTLVEYEL